MNNKAAKPKPDWSPAQANHEFSNTSDLPEVARSPASPKDSGQNDDSAFDDGVNTDEHGKDEPEQ